MYRKHRLKKVKIPNPSLIKVFLKSLPVEGKIRYLCGNDIDFYIEK